MKKFLLALLFFFCVLYSFAGDTSRVVFLRMDADIDKPTSAFMEGRLYTDHIYYNDQSIGGIRSCSIFIYDALKPEGTYYLLPTANPEVASQQKIEITPKAGSITFIKFTLRESPSIVSSAEVVDVMEFEKCYENNKWLRKKLAENGYASVQELARGFTPSGKDVEKYEIRTSKKPIIKRNPSDTAFYKDNGYKTSRDSAEYFNILTRERPGYYLATAYYLDSGQLRSTVHFSDIDSEIKQGPYILYSKKGFVANKGEYLNNKKIGVWEYYRDTLNAALWHTCSYTGDGTHWLLTSYYPGGKVKRKEHHESSEKMVLSTDYFTGRKYISSESKDTIIKGSSYDEQGNEIPFVPFEVMPLCPYNLNAYLARTMKYPSSARKKSIEGRVIVKFIVNENGTVSDVLIAKSVYKDLDNEAVRVVSGLPPWIPGKMDDKPVKVYYNLPILFKLE